MAKASKRCVTGSTHGVLGHKPTRRGRPHVTWEKETRWFTIQLAVLAKEAKLVNDDLPERNRTPSPPSRAPRRHTRPLLPNLDAAKFAVYWAHGLQPHVNVDEHGRTWICFRKADVPDGTDNLIVSDIRHVRRVLDSEIEYFLPGDQSVASFPNLPVRIETQRQAFPRISLMTALKVLNVQQALLGYLLPHDKTFPEVESFVRQHLEFAGWESLVKPLFHGLDAMPDMAERIRRIGTLTPMTRGTHPRGK